MTEEKKFKNLIRFHSANKIGNYNRGGRKKKRRKKERERIQKNLQNKSKHKNKKYFSWVIPVRVLSLSGSHSPPHLPRMPSNTVLISGPAVGAAQILIWSRSSVFLPSMSADIRTSAFSFVGALNDLFYIPETQSLDSWLCGSNLQLAPLVGRFWVFFLSHTAPGFQLWCYFHLCMWVVHWGLLLRLPWRSGSAPVRARGGGGAAAWVAGALAAPGPQGGWWLGRQEIECSRRVWQPVLASTLQYFSLEKPPDREAWQATVYRVTKSWTPPKRP